jgi:hypothetical protein
MTATDLPLLSFFQRVLDPLIIMGMLYLSSMLLGEPFTGYALVLTVMAFFISSSVYEHVDPYSAWRGGRMMASARNVVFGWIITAVILVLLASLSGFTSHYSQNVVVVWFISTPIVLVVSHLAAGGPRGRPPRPHHPLGEAASKSATHSPRACWWPPPGRRAVCGGTPSATSTRGARPSSSAPTRPASASLKRWSTTRTCS